MTQATPDPNTGRIENAADRVTPGEAITSVQKQAALATQQEQQAPKGTKKSASARK